MYPGFCYGYCERFERTGVVCGEKSFGAVILDGGGFGEGAIRDVDVIEKGDHDACVSKSPEEFFGGDVGGVDFFPVRKDNGPCG